MSSLGFVSRLLLDRVVEAHLGQLVVAAVVIVDGAALVVERRLLVVGDGRALFAFVELLHLYVGVLDVLFVGGFAGSVGVFVVTLFDVDFKGRVFFVALLNQLEVVVAQSSLG